jgi:hypothetical protein
LDTQASTSIIYLIFIVINLHTNKKIFKMMLLAQGPGLCPSLFISSSAQSNISSGKVIVQLSEEVIVATQEEVKRELFGLGFEGPLSAVAPIFRSVWIQ